MKLEYKILWLDDKINEFIEDEVIDEIKEHLIENNFIPNIVTVDNSKDFFENLDDSYDIILTDYHMNDINGDKVIEEIRSDKYSVMTEVLFYTAKADLKDTQKISRVSFLETATIPGTHIENVIEHTQKLIDLTIKKFQHIVSMRGMIMQETSSLDVEMELLLSKMIQKSDKPDEIIKTIIQKYTKGNEDFNENIKDLTIKDLETVSFRIGASHRWRALKRNLPKGEIKTVLNDYDSEIISIRNKFAHAVLKTDKDGRDYFENKKEGIEFNNDFCNQIRKNIIKHKKNLESLNDLLGQ